jgi:4'-phosphopantetheinyl transferase
MIDEGDWKSPPKSARLLTSEVHLWRIQINLFTDRIHQFLTYLSKEERSRMNRFRFEKDQNRFAITHACLRDILSRYLSTSPNLVTFSSGTYGKPEISNLDLMEPLQFNLSQSEDLALVAVASERKVGVDVERVKKDIPIENISRRFFSSIEIDSILSLPVESQTAAFFSCWTRKEAYLKARGEGLSIPLNQFEVSVSTDEQPILIDTVWDKVESSRWTFRHLTPAPDYFGALVVEGSNWDLYRWDWIENN